MKTSIKRYKHFELKQVQDNLSNKNKKLIEGFLSICGSTAGKSKLKNIERVMVKIVDIMELDLDKITLDKFREFLVILKQADLMPPTKNEMKKHLKRFIKEFYPDWNIKFKSFKDMKLEKEINHEKINSNTLLSEEEIGKLIRCDESIKVKALISLLYETAGRPEEILKLKWKDINLEKESIKLYSSKTGDTRELMIVTSAPHLKRLKTEYPFEDRNNDDFIFPSDKGRDRHMCRTALYTLINKIGKKVLDKHVYPYLLRHSRLKILQKKLPAILYEKFAGHSFDVANKYYNHMDTEDLRDALMFNVYQVEDMTPEEKDSLKKELESVKQQLGEYKKTEEEKREEFRIGVFKIIKKMKKELGEKYKEIL